MRCKICGITNYKDAMVAIDAGADAIGFIFYENSPRYIEPIQAKSIIEKLPPFVEKVALFVEEDAQTINSIAKDVGATLLQIHFDAPAILYKELALPFIRVIRAKSKDDIFSFPDEYKLIDAFSESFGGTGKRLNLEWFENNDNSKIILAGGLDDANVASLKKYGFYGVDVSSGVEQSHGKKDHQKVTNFIRNAKN